MKSSTSLFVLASMLSMLFAPLAPAQEDVIITEFMASNTKIAGTFDYHDEDNDYSDWIEIYNNSLNTVNLENWSLTDNADNLGKWHFPATNITSHQFIVVWASGKNRRVPGMPLHTSFKLSASSGYLALVRPDNSIATEFSPTYPPQVTDVSYGFGLTQMVFTVVATNAPLRAFVPNNGNLGTAWMQPGFDDSGWLSGPNGAGYDTGAVNPGEDLAASVILTTSPAGYWRFSESSGTVATNAGSSGINGNYQNVTLSAVGPRPPTFGGFEANNTAVQFNGAATNNLTLVTGSNVQGNIAGGTGTDNLFLDGPPHRLLQ